MTLMTISGLMRLQPQLPSHCYIPLLQPLRILNFIFIYLIAYSASLFEYLIGISHLKYLNRLLNFLPKLFPHLVFHISINVIPTFTLTWVKISGIIFILLLFLNPVSNLLANPVALPSNYSSSQTVLFHFC